MGRVPCNLIFSGSSLKQRELGCVLNSGLNFCFLILFRACLSRLSTKHCRLFSSNDRNKSMRLRIGFCLIITN